MGPSKTKVWNSPFHASVDVGGKIMEEGFVEFAAAKLGPRTLSRCKRRWRGNVAGEKIESIHGLSRFQMGKRAVMPMRARFFSR